MGNFGRDNNRGGGFSRGGFNRGGDRGGRPSFGGRGFGGGNDRGPREMFKTTCSNCGKDCEVPFRPTNGKPVYCSDCFEKMGNGGRSDDRRPERTDFRPQAQVSAPNSSQLDALNVKLDKIISLLEQKEVSKPATEEVPTPKVKKTPIKK